MTSRVLCKATAWLMTAILLITSLLTAMPLTALAEGDPVSLTLGDVSGLPGETVRVPLSVQSTKGLANFDATITYNSSVFTVGDGEWNTSALGGNPYYDFVDLGNGTLKVVYIGTSNTSANAELLYIPLTIASGTTSGSYSLGLQVGGLQVYDDVYGDDFGAYSPSVYTYSGNVTVRTNPGAVTFKVSPASSSIASGATVAVNIMLESTSGVSNFGLTVSFDKSKLTPVQQSDGEWAVWNSSVMGSASSSKYFVTNYNSTNGSVYLGYIASKANTSASGKIATIYFQAASLTSAATVTITPSNNDAQYYAPSHGDADEYGYVTPSISLTSGTVSIKAATTTTTTKATTTTTKATTTTTKATTTTTKATTTTTKATTTTTKATTTTTKATTTTTTSLDIRETITLSAGVVTGAQVGDIIQVPIMMSDNHYALSGTIDIGYTAAVLEPQEIADGKYIDAINTTVIPGGSGTVTLASSGKLRLTFSSTKMVGGVTSGALVILNFKVLSYVAETPITLTVSAMKSNNGYSGGQYNTNYAVQNGAVQQTTPVTTKTTTGTHPTAATPVTFTVVSNTDVVHSGQVVAMDIVLDSKLGLSNFGLTLTFNNNALTPIAHSDDYWAEWNTAAVGATSSSVYIDDNYIPNGASSTIKLSYVASKKNTPQAQCVIATVYFRVSETYLGNSASKTVTVTPSCSDAQYYDTVNGNKYGYVTPSATTLTKETLTLYQPLTIEYYSMTDMVHTMTVANTGAAVTPPDLAVTPKKLNYSFIDWVIKSQTATLIQVEAIYGYIVEVTSGSITSSYVPSGQWLTSSKKAYFNAPSTYNGGILGYDNRVQVVASATSGTKVFSYWKDAQGNVVSYDRTFTFFVPGNVTLTPVYATTAAAKTPTASMQIVRGEYNNPTNQKGSITWVCAFNRGDTAKYAVNEWGIIYGPSTVYSDLTSGDTTKARKEVATGYSQDSNQYSYTINNVSVGKTRSAIAYVTYTEVATGKSYTVYSPNLLSMTMANTL